MSWTTDAWTTARTVTVDVRGDIHQVDESADFKETVMELAQEAGLQNFRVLVDGRNVEPHEAPSTFAGIHTVQITMYDKAG